MFEDMRDRYYADLETIIQEQDEGELWEAYCDDLLEWGPKDSLVDRSGEEVAQVVDGKLEVR